MDLPADVVQRAQGGDPEAFRAVVEATAAWLYALACRMERDRTEAEDALQEIFLRLHRSFAQYDGARPFGPWLRTLAVRTILNRRRKRRERPSGEPMPEPAAPLEKTSDLAEVFRGLPDGQRDALALKYEQGLTVEEIARELEVPSGTVKTWLHRGRLTLAERLRRVP